MNKNIIKLWLLGAVLAATACSKTEPEVITEDPSYKLDAKEISVETPAKFVYNTDNVLRNESANTVGLDIKVIDGAPEINTTKIPLTFRLRRALSQDLVIQLVKDESLLARYSGDRENVQSFPEGTFSGLTVTIPAGKLTHTADVVINNHEQLTHIGGYLTAFRIDVPSDVSMAEEGKTLFVRANVTTPKILLLDEMPQNWSEVDRERYYFSTTRFPWTAYTDRATLAVTRSAQKPSVSGLSIRMDIPTRTMKTVRIRAYNNSIADGETFEVITLPAPRGTVYIRFTTPLTYSRIEITGINSFMGSSTVIHEVKLYHIP